MTIGERIRQQREKIGMQQTALADAVNTTKQNIYKYETGIITNIPSDKIEAIAAVLNVTPAYLMGWDEPTPASPISPADQSLLDAYHRAPQEIRDIVNTALTPYYSKEEMKVG